MRDAAAGLCAAHEAGLLHRDFKPDNIFLADDGRVRVMDLGLASVVGDTGAAGSEPDGSVEASGGRLDSLGERLTRTGTVLGTPAYMAPEQWEGTTLDARTDQFAFAVTTWEGLFGRRPFTGSTGAELRDAIRAGVMTPTPPDRPVPRRVVDALRRALSPNPDDRFESLETLLRALELPRRRWVWVAGAAGLVAVAGGMAQLGTAESGPACDGGRTRVSNSWSEAQAQTLRRAFERGAPAYATTTFATVEGALSRYADGWANAVDATCRAGRDGTQTDRERDATMACLERGLAQLDATVGALSRGEPATVEHAPAAVFALPAVELCLEPQRIVDDPKVAELEAELVELRMRARADDATATHQALAELAERAEGLGSPRVHAMALNALARRHEHAGDLDTGLATADQAIEVAEAAGVDEQAAVGWMTTAFVHGQRGAWPAAERAEGFARAALARIGDPPRLLAGLELDRGMRLYVAGRFDDALQALAHALRQVDQVHDAPILRARAHSLRGTIEVAQGQLEQALASHEAAEAIIVAEQGELHPSRVFELANATNALSKLGRDQEALARLELARDVLRKSGAERPDVEAQLSNNIANLRAEGGDVQGAVDELSEGLARLDAAGDPEHSAYPILLGNLALNLGRLGRHEDALETHRRSLAMRETRLGEDHYSCAYSWQGIGDALMGLLRPADAAEAYARGLALRENTGLDPYEIAESQYGLAKARYAVDAGDPRVAPMLDAAEARIANDAQPDSARLREAITTLRRASGAAPDDAHSGQL